MTNLLGNIFGTHRPSTGPIAPQKTGSGTDADEYRKLYEDALKGPQNHFQSADMAHKSLRMALNGYSAAQATTPSVEDEGFRKRILGMRLRLSDGQRWPFQHLDTACGNDKVFVFILHNEKPVVLEDDKNLYPSDTLLSQIHLLIG